MVYYHASVHCGPSGPLAQTAFIKTPDWTGEEAVISSNQSSTYARSPGSSVNDAACEAWIYIYICCVSHPYKDAQDKVLKA